MSRLLASTRARTSPLPLECVADRVGHSFVGWGTAGQSLDNGAGGLFRDAANITHRCLLGGGDRLFRIRQPDVELILEGLAAGIRFRGLLVARFIRDRLRAAARIRQRLLVGRRGLVGLGLQRACFGDIAFDMLAPALDDCRRRAATPASPSAHRAARR